MGIFNKMKFWQKDDEFSLDDNPFGNVNNQNNNPLEHSMDNNSLNNDFMNHNAINNQQNSMAQNNTIDDPKTAIDMIRNGKISEVKQEIHPEQASMQKEFEILSSKLDTIKMGIESMNQRLQNLERMQNQKNEIRF